MNVKGNFLIEFSYSDSYLDVKTFCIMLPSWRKWQWLFVLDIFKKSVLFSWQNYSVNDMYHLRVLEYKNTNLLNHILVSDCVVNGMYFCMSCIQIKMQNRNNVHVAAFDCQFCVQYIRCLNQLIYYMLLKETYEETVKCFSIIWCCVLLLFIFFSVYTYRIDYNSV
jgi:heme/copper-type cytochrome/quinol oxidase subunit 4